MKCEICGKDCNGIQALSNHIGRMHGINTIELKKDYFDKYRKDSTGFCLTCHKPTKYLDFTQGYADYCSHKCNPEYKNNEIYVCKLCNEDFIWKKDLCQHLKRKHNQDIKIYYDTYIKKNNEGICPVCKKPTKFNSLYGYTQYCSAKCQHSDPEYNEKIAQSTFEHYGVRNAFNIPEVQEKARQSSQSKEAREKRTNTYIKKYGCKNPMQSKEVQQKAINTCIERYGGTGLGSVKIRDKILNTTSKKYNNQTITSPMQIKSIAKKCHDTQRQKYGKLAFNTDKQKETMVEKYGVEFGSQSEEIREKIKQTMIKKYGVTTPLADSCKMKQANKEKYGVESNMQVEELKNKNIQSRLDGLKLDSKLNEEDL